MHKLWDYRAKLDISFSNLRQIINPSQRTSYSKEGLLARSNIPLNKFEDSAMCYTCGSLFKAEAFVSNPRLYAPQEDRMMSRCYNCKQNLPRCAVCMDRLQIVN